MKSKLPHIVYPHWLVRNLLHIHIHIQAHALCIHKHFLSWHHNLKSHRGRAISASYSSVIPASDVALSLQQMYNNPCPLLLLCVIPQNWEFGRAKTASWLRKQSQQDMSKRSRNTSIQTQDKFFICQNLGQEETLLPSFSPWLKCTLQTNVDHKLSFYMWKKRATSES